LRHLDELAAETRPIAVAGLSMGGLLALDAASRDRGPVAAVTSLAAPLWLAGGGRLLGALGRLPRRLTAHLGSIPKSGGGSDVRDPENARQNPGYRVLPLAGVVELTRLMRDVRRRLPRVRCPLLVVHGRQDHTAPPASAAEIFATASSRDKQLVIVPESYHLVTHDVERDRVAEVVAAFLHRVLQPRS
jgi:carboxylesterase